MVKEQGEEARMSGKCVSEDIGEGPTVPRVAPQSTACACSARTPLPSLRSTHCAQEGDVKRTAQEAKDDREKAPRNRRVDKGQW